MNQSPESQTQTPESSHISQAIRQKLGQAALPQYHEQKRSESLPDAKNLSEDRQRLLDEMKLPINEPENINKCYDFLLNTALDGTIKKTASHKFSVSRVLRLDDYKAPDWSEKDTPEIDKAIQLDITDYMLGSIRKTYKEGGVEAVKKEFPKIQTSGVEWTQILTISKPTLEMYINNPEAPIGNSLKAIIQYSEATSEHSGDELHCPYKVQHKNGKIDYNQERTDGRYRFYLNCPSGNLRRDFLVTYAKKCIDHRLPFDLKGMEVANTGEATEPNRADGVIIYLEPDHLEDALKIMQEINEEKPDLTNKFGTPPITAGQMSFFGVAQSRREATWNYLFDRVSRWAFYKTALESMFSSGTLTKEAKEQLQNQLQDIHDNDTKLSRGNPDWPPEILDYIKANTKVFNGDSMRTRFNMNLKTLFSKANFGDEKHTNYPFCFSDAFYSPLENQ